MTTFRDTPATVPMSRQFDFASRETGRSYRIQVSLPVSAPAASRCSVLYVIDGDLHFAATAAAVRLRSLVGEIAPVAVVGIGYPEAQEDVLACLRRRNTDLTPTPGSPALKDSVSRQLGGLEIDDFGDADRFLEMIEQEIKPRIPDELPVAKGQDILFGHSLGGLVTVHALLTRPNSFRTFLALSPSLWWDHRVVLAGEAAFARLVEAKAAAPAVFIGVGEYEQSPAHIPQLSAQEVLDAAMVDNARELAGRLAGLRGGADYRVGQQVFAGQTHSAVVQTAMNTLLDFALAPGH